MKFQENGNVFGMAVCTRCPHLMAQPLTWALCCHTGDGTGRQGMAAVVSPSVVGTDPEQHNSVPGGEGTQPGLGAGREKAGDNSAVVTPE